MVEILARNEDMPAAFPAVPVNLSEKAQALDSDMIWQRIEAYTAHRWSERQVIWIVQGPGCFVPDLTPATVTATEIWEAGAWTDTVLSESWEGGHVLLGDGPYRFTATVGGGTPPPDAFEAFKRLAEYQSDYSNTAHEPGANSYSFKVGDGLQWDIQRNPAWMARAMQYSGAGDLLRNYRRA